MLTVVAFIVAIAVLVVVHELGHFAMAILCGVKVLRFSVGFGPRLFGWTSPQWETEFVVAAIPLGGFVKMLDEREGAVSSDQVHRAFNVQPLRSRAAIVVAGPLANLLLAVVVYASVNWIGVELPQPVLARPIEASAFAVAGFVGGERVSRIGFDGADPEVVASFEDVRWWLMQAALERRDVQVEYFDSQGSSIKRTQVALGELDTNIAEAQLARLIGVMGPYSEPRVGEISPGSAAQAAGLWPGDVVLQVDATAMRDAAHLRETIRKSGMDGVTHTQVWTIRRSGAVHTLLVKPALVPEQKGTVGRVGAYIGAPPAIGLVRYGFTEGLQKAFRRTIEVASLTLRVIGQIVVGNASLGNLSGPITIADYAGKSAAIGAMQYLTFLALISISLGVLNLLPVPVLDGGHLMYYLWESLSGKPVSDSWMEWLQRLGVTALLVLMAIAVFNDVARIMG